MPKCDETKLLDDAMHKESIPKGKQARGDREAKCALWKAAVEEYITEGLPREMMVAISNAAEREAEAEEETNEETEITIADLEDEEGYDSEDEWYR